MIEKPIGYYRLSLVEPNGIEFIHNNEEIEILFSDTILQNNLYITKSTENKLLWQYKYFGKALKSTEKELIVKQSYLPKGNNEWQKLQRKRDSLTLIKRDYLSNLCDANPDLLFAKLVTASVRPIYLTEQERKHHFFDNIDFADPVLIRGSILSSAMMKYFQLHTEYSEEGFQLSTDRILSLASANDENYEFCLNFILDLFNRVGPDIVFQYVVETYLLDGGCSDANVSEHIAALAENYKAVLPGNKAPSFQLNDCEGVPLKLEDELINSDYTVLFFWSSHCGFCTETTPKLIKWIEKKPNVQIIGISLDTEADELKTHIDEHKLPWRNVSDLKGWKSETVLSYKIHKTPSFYVLDKKGIIIAKPKNFEAFSELNLENVK